MKKLVVFLFLAIGLFAQTNTSYYHGDSKVWFTYEDAMTDSVGNYYSQAIDIDELSPDLTFLPISWLHSSAEGAVSVTTTLEGRVYNPVSGSYESWVTIDSIASASSTETLQFSAVGLAGGERPDQVRVKFDGQAGNRNDTVIKLWVKVIE